MKAYQSHIKAYTTHPSEMKGVFNLKKLHLGHLAKSFGLRDAPGQVKSKREFNNDKREADKPRNKRFNIDEFGNGMPRKARKMYW